MNSFRITRGTVTLTTPDGETIELAILGNDADSRLCDGRNDIESINWPSGWSGTFTVSANSSGDVERLFNEMQAEYLRQQLREATREGWRLLSIVDPSAKTLEPGEMVTMQFARDHWRIIEPMYQEPRRKVAQWKRERSPMRYTRN